jgi:hypothetical protein
MISTPHGLVMTVRSEAGKKEGGIPSEELSL